MPRDIANQKRKTDYIKIKIVSFIINFQHDMKIINTYLELQHGTRYPNIIPPTDLCGYVTFFILAVSGKDGSDYELFTGSFNTHMISKGYTFSLISDVQFLKCRNVVPTKQKQLKSIGKGNKPHAADSNPDSEVDPIYAAQVLGSEFSLSLLAC